MATTSEFWRAAQEQRACANCGSVGAFDAHHVVKAQRLRARGNEELLWHPDGALRLCSGLDSNRCHENHTSRKMRVPTSRLKQANVCFIWEALGVAGHNYLEAEYTGVDRRFTLHEEGRCPRCQLQ